MKKVIVFALMALMLFVATAAAPAPATPNVTFELLNGLPTTMNVGETYYVEVRITSDVEFNAAMAMPDMFFPGRYVVAHGVNREGAGTSAVLSVPFTAISSTANLPDGVAPVSVAAGLRFKGGLTVGQTFPFNVSVP